MVSLQEAPASAVEVFRADLPNEPRQEARFLVAQCRSCCGDVNDTLKQEAAACAWLGCCLHVGAALVAEHQRRVGGPGGVGGSGSTVASPGGGHCTCACSHQALSSSRGALWL